MNGVTDDIRRMRNIWETRFKPHIEILMEVDEGHYSGIILACHCCEHAYKAIYTSNGHVMQEALESALRLHNFYSAKDRGIVYEPCDRPHWNRKLSHEIRDFILNPTKA